MSSKSERTGKNPRSERDGGAASPAANKRQKQITGIVQSNRSLLLDSSPEILRKMYSFLTLKEALVLRRTHRQFNESSNDIYQYSVIMNFNALSRQGFTNDSVLPYISKQTEALYNLADNENLRAFLRNETMNTLFIVRRFLSNLVNNSKTDNGQAVSFLIQDERYEVGIDDLEICLKKGFTAMAAVLQQDERVKKDMQMCHTCSNNIGCYWCTNNDECVVDDVVSRYCRECVLKDDHFCQNCNHYLCPACFEAEVFERCDKCGSIECRYYNCEQMIMKKCALCNQNKCISCINDDGEHWIPAIEVDDHGNDMDVACCPACSQNAVNAAIEAANNRG